MKKLILVLAICLIASQSFGVSISLVRQGTTNVFDVQYSGNGTTAATRIRGLAIDLTVDNSATFTSFVPSSYKTGESTASSRGYGIYPATIVIDSTGAVTNSGTPLAAAGDPGAGTGLTTNHIVLEFGSLYFAEANAPAASGTLCSINLNRPVTSSTTTVTMQAEATYRGGVVMEDGSQSNASATGTLAFLPDVTLPSPPTALVPATGSTKVYKLTDLSWTAGAGATSYDVYFGTVLPATATNVTTTSFDTGTMAVNKTYQVQIWSVNSSGRSATALTGSFTTECFPGVSTDAKYVQWNNVGKPDCWCSVIVPRQCKGDADNTKESKSNFWVYTNDLNVLKAAWGQTYSAIAGQSAGTPAALKICADFDHVFETKSSFRVYTNDLNILKANWGVANGPAGDCSTQGY